MGKHNSKKHNKVTEITLNAPYILLVKEKLPQL